MRRIPIVIVVILFLSSAGLNAQGAQPANRRVRITTAGHQIVGTLIGADERNVTMSTQRGDVVTVPRSAITQVERSTGTRSRMRNAMEGLLIGGGGGAGVGFLVGNSRRCPGILPGSLADQPCFLEPEGSTFGGFIVGGGAGALIGSLVHPRERWIVVPVDSLQGR